MTPGNMLDCFDPLPHGHVGTDSEYKIHATSPYSSAFL